jgi:hypothetical protein
MKGILLVQKLKISNIIPNMTVLCYDRYNQLWVCKTGEIVKNKINLVCLANKEQNHLHDISKLFEFVIRSTEVVSNRNPFNMRSIQKFEILPVGSHQWQSVLDKNLFNQTVQFEHVKQKPLEPYNNLCIPIGGYAKVIIQPEIEENVQTQPVDFIKEDSYAHLLNKQYFLNQAETDDKNFKSFIVNLLKDKIEKLNIKEKNAEGSMMQGHYSATVFELEDILNQINNN